MTDPRLATLAHRMGVAVDYHDWVGNLIAVDDATVIAALAALGVRADTEEACATALSDHHRRHWARTLPPTVMARSGTESPFWVHVTHGDPAQVWVRLDSALRARPGPGRR